MMQPNKVTKVLFSIFLGIGVLLAAVTVGVYAASHEKAVLVAIGVQAVVWLLIGGIGLGVVYGKVRRDRTLMETGNCVKAKVTEIYQDRSMNMNGRSPFRVSCQYTDEGTQTIYVFRSNPLWFDPTSNLTGATVDVYVDYNNFKKYYVNVESLMSGYRVEVL